MSERCVRGRPVAGGLATINLPPIIEEKAIAHIEHRFVVCSESVRVLHVASCGQGVVEYHPCPRWSQERTQTAIQSARQCLCVVIARQAAVLGEDAHGAARAACFAELAKKAAQTRHVPYAARERSLDIHQPTVEAIVLQQRGELLRHSHTIV